MDEQIQAVKHDVDVRIAALMQLQGVYAKGLIGQTFNPNSGLFSPGTPVAPLGGDSEPREFEYQAGYNLYIQPRAGEKYGSLSFPTLRALGKASKEIRLNVEHIKRQMRGLRLDFVSNTPTVEAGGQVYRATAHDAEARALFGKPDGEYDWSAWLNMLIEELLVTDAVTLYPVYKMGKLAKLRIIDGTTIRPFLDYAGTRPEAPAPAYGQILYGRMSSWYSANQLIYRPLNTKVYSPYGESPIEWIVLAINTAIRHDLQRVGAFTEGNIPGAFMTVPPEWTPEQIQQYNDFINAILAGDTNRVNKVLFIPGGTGQNLYQFAQNDVDKIEVDKFLMQVACWAYGNDPSEFNLVPGEGLGGKGWTEAASMRQYQNMTKQVANYLEALLNEIVHVWMGLPGLDVKLIGAEPPQNAALLLSQDQQYLGTVYNTEYVQDRMGIPARYRPVAGAKAPGGQDGAPEFGPKPVDDYVTYTTPAIPRHDAPKAPGLDTALENAPTRPAGGGGLAPFVKKAVEAELKVWAEKAGRALKKGWEQQPFKSDILPAELRAGVFAQLQKAVTLEQVTAIFDGVEFDPGEVLRKEFGSDGERRAAFANMRADGTYDESQAEGGGGGNVWDEGLDVNNYSHVEYAKVFKPGDFIPIKGEKGTNWNVKRVTSSKRTGWTSPGISPDEALTPFEYETVTVTASNDWAQERKMTFGGLDRYYKHNKKGAFRKAVSQEGDGLESPFLLKSGAITVDPDEEVKRAAEGEFGAAVLGLYAGLPERLVSVLKSR